MTTPDPTLVVTPDEARAQAEKLEGSVASGDTITTNVTEARDTSRDESASYVGEYAPDEAFPDIQVPAQHVGVGLMLLLERRKSAWAKRSAGIRGAVAELEEMDTENGEAIDAVDTDLDQTTPETPKVVPA
ncbi:Uncharacterised protein [Mycobacteroides abscessus subsp. abscessus]|uniref:hypothetical protein n=1 Tax=Mycobacteroides abscessus TaxID=36809 RepID=UPI0009298FA0|nr:hypothetical protein [Mycobacteroides abscessus]SIC64644.1 Uncharacterised protein [Mycobacteroides abscessus subsp. abscessus]SIG65638.1 Uncharacterised protein [Mycobacteroides abscessus subsp. abscessus]